MVNLKLFIQEMIFTLYQISTFEQQRDNCDMNISSIDLGACEEKLKNYYNISQNNSLLIAKIDLKNEDKTRTHVYYEVFNPENFDKLDLNLCNNKIIINTPIDLDENTISLYEDLKKYNYNLFDLNDKFYTDICSLYTTNKGTDIILEQRKKKIFSKYGNISLCQSGCEFILYNITTKKSKCNCDIPEESSEESLKNFDFNNFNSKKFTQKFTKTITNSNFQVLKCYKSPFYIKNIFYNIGRIIMSVIYLIYLICIFIFIIKEKNKLNNILKDLLKNRNETVNIIKKSTFNQNKKLKEKKLKINNNKSQKSKRKKNIQNNKTKNRKNSTEKNKINEKKYKLNQERNKIDILYKDLNEGELNSLSYQMAIKIDKRTFCQYYCSLLKTNHLILFTFILNNDYNLFSNKFALFLLNISLDMTINAFFFSDETMNKITEAEGSFEIIYQIPQIIYSTLISYAINPLLQFLSLSENDIIRVKQEKNVVTKAKLLINIKKTQKIKFFVFYILSNIFLLFFWYFISCFCGVYINTQMILFKDTISSFCLSLLYPFITSLIPGLLRIEALRCPKHDKEYMYKIGNFISEI